MPDCKNDQDGYRWSMTEFLTTQDNIVTINGQSCKLKMTRDEKCQFQKVQRTLAKLAPRSCRFISALTGIEQHYFACCIKSKLIQNQF